MGDLGRSHRKPVNPPGERKAEGEHAAKKRRAGWQEVGPVGADCIGRILEHVAEWTLRIESADDARGALVEPCREAEAALEAELRLPQRP